MPQWRNLNIKMLHIQWNPSITDTFGEQCLTFIQRGCLYTNCSLGTWVSGHYIDSEVVVNRGSTVTLFYNCTVKNMGND